MANNKKAIRRLTELAIFTAMGVALVVLINFPIFPSAPFLKYDPADIPIIIATFAYGPLSGILTTVIISVIQGVTVSADGTGLGIIMHILATGSYVLVAGLIYRRKKDKTHAIMALAAGTIVMCAVMALLNMIAMPLFLHVPLENILPMILPVIVPFNLIKAGINSAVVFFVYKHVKALMRSV